jgi:hypothetical protein
VYPASEFAPGGASSEGSAPSVVADGVLVVLVGAGVVVAGRVVLATGVVVDDAVAGEVVGFGVVPEPRITLGIRDKGRVVVTGASIDAGGVVDVPDVVRLTDVDVWVRIGALTEWVLAAG